MCVHKITSPHMVFILGNGNVIAAVNHDLLGFSLIAGTNTYGNTLCIVLRTSHKVIGSCWFTSTSYGSSIPVIARNRSSIPKSAQVIILGKYYNHITVNLEWKTPKCQEDEDYSE